MADVSRTPHAFDNLNWLVVVNKSTPGQWEKPDGTLTNKFVFHTLANTSGYGIVDDVLSLVDQDLSIDPVNFNLGEGPHKTPLSPIPSAGFSISNLELFYHQISEINGDDLNLFEGARVVIYMASSLIPGYFWNGSTWISWDGSIYPPFLQFPDPNIISPQYPTNEFSWIIFTGTIQSISFSAATTSFDCIGINDLQNVALGSLADVQAQAKDRGKILPISYGKWQGDGDLMPVILDRDQQDVPRIILGEFDHQSIDGIRLFDKVSERDFFVLNTFSPNAGNTEIEFREDTASADLGAAVPEDITIWDQGVEVDSLLADRYSTIGETADEQILTSIDDELVAFHDDAVAPLLSDTGYGDNNTDLPASRVWGDSVPSEHDVSSELFELDVDYQKATAVIAFSMPILGLYKSEESTQKNSLSGSFWETLRTADQDESTAPSFQKFTQSLKKAGDIYFGDGIYSFAFEKIGLKGEVLSIISNMSTWSDLGPGTFPLEHDYQTSILIELRDSGGSITSFSGITSFFSLAAPTANFDPITAEIISSSTAQGNNDWWKSKITTQFFGGLPTFDEITAGAISIHLELEKLPSSILIADVFNIPDFLSFSVRAKVEAQDGLWFVQGQARDDGAAVIDTPTEAIQDIFTKDLKFTDFGFITSNRSGWSSDFSIFGKQKKWRKVLKEFTQEFAMGSFSDRKGQENFIDLDLGSVTLDISPDMVLKNANLQAVDYSFTDRDDLYNEILVKFRQNPANGDFLNVIQINEDTVESTIPLEFLALDAPGIRSRLAEASLRLGLTSGEKKTLIIESSFIRRTRTAERLIEVLSQWWTSTKAIVTVRGTFSNFYFLKLGDQVTFNFEWGGLPNKILDSQFMIIGHIINPSIKGGSGSIVLKLIEIPPL